MGTWTVNLEDMNEFVIGRIVAKVLHANASFFPVQFGDKSLHQSREDLEILIFSG